jgi:hypothetical protein
MPGMKRMWTCLGISGLAVIVGCGDGAAVRESGAASIASATDDWTSEGSESHTSAGSTTADSASATTASTTQTSSGDDTTMGESCEPGAEACVDGEHQLCVDGTWIDDPCPVGLTCIGDTCSTVCTPGSSVCIDAGSYEQCNEDGSAWGRPTACDVTEVCESGQCLSQCQLAEATKSNVGCEFWAVDMPNLPPRDTYVYAVAISNPSHDDDVTVRVYDGNDGGNEQLLITETIPPRQVRVLNLSGTHSGQVGHYAGDAGFNGTGIAVGRAFRITSELPVVATQFNPIGGASGHTTDASLLLPTHTLAHDYIHLAWAQGHGDGSNLIVVGTQANTTVTITPTVGTTAGQNGLPAMTAGAPTQVTIGAYDYVQLSTGSQDLSGSVITSSAPVAVFGGHTCANVPTTATTACDHVEEQIFPLETWGHNYVAARNPQRANEAMVWRVVAAEDATTITFDPPVSVGAQTMMNATDVLQFSDGGDFHASADKPIMIAGYMVGCSAAGGGCPGDPYMVLMVPEEQYQDDYVFLVDTSYDQDFAKLIRPAGAQIDVECLGVVPAERWSPVGGSGWEVATIDMNPGEALCTTGTNEATGTAPFGIIVSGQASAASYAYAGGLALQPINPQ